MTITILPTQSKQKYVLDLLKSNSSIGDTSFVSLSVYLNTLVSVEKQALWMACAKVLNNLSRSSDISILKQVLNYPITVDQVLRFVQRMADEGWSLDDLPQQSLKEKELILVLKEVLPCTQGLFDQWRAFHAQDLRSVSVLTHLYPYAVQRQLNQAKYKGLKSIEIEAVSDVKRSVRFHNNPASEAQAAVQALLTSSLPYGDQSLVCLDANLMDQVESFLIHYEVPYQKVGHGSNHPIFRFYQDILAFKDRQDAASLSQLIQNDVLELPYKLSLLNYLEAFKPEVVSLLNPLSHVVSAFNSDALKTLLNEKSYLVLEQESEKSISVLRPTLDELLHAQPSSHQSFMSVCFEFMMKSVDLSESNLKAIYTLKDWIESCQIQQLEGVETWLDYVYYQISKLSLSAKAQTGVILTDLSHGFIPGLKRQIWLSCTQANYPAFKTESGLFDDAYFLGIKDYSLKDRYLAHLQQLTSLQNIAPEIIYSYALGTYDGKAQRMPYELETVLKDKGESKRWDLVEDDVRDGIKELKLDADIASSLYFKEGLKGSITSFEQYFHCPYKYFLNRGLNLREQEELSFEKKALGNLMHTLLDHAVKHAGKQYATYLSLNMSDLIQPYIDALEALFPHELQEIHLIKLKTLDILNQSLVFLQDREANTDYGPMESEYPFDLNYPLNNGESIHFKGIIDRVDTLNQDAVIIDYKSSPMNFSEDKFIAGVKLQLPTYAYALSQASLKLQAAFYFSLSPQMISLSAEPSFDLRKEALKARRLNGFIFSKNPQLDKNQEHIVSFNLNKSGSMSYPTPFDFEKTMEELKKLYTSLYDGLKEGHIAKQNKNDSCKYCPYRGFCQFKGPKTLIPKINIENTKVRQT